MVGISCATLESLYLGVVENHLKLQFQVSKQKNYLYLETYIESFLLNF